MESKIVRGEIKGKCLVEIRFSIVDSTLSYN
jgi:hypothetical protein